MERRIPEEPSVIPKIGRTRWAESHAARDEDLPTSCHPVVDDAEDAEDRHRQYYDGPLDSGREQRCYGGCARRRLL